MAEKVGALAYGLAELKWPAPEAMGRRSCRLHRLFRPVLPGELPGLVDDLVALLDARTAGVIAGHRQRKEFATTSPTRAPLVNMSRRIASSRLSRKSGPCKP